MSPSRLPVLLVLAASLLVLASCQPLPVVLPVTKNPPNSHYIILFDDGTNYVVDITGPLTMALPAQVASSHTVPEKLLLCLPTIGDGDGVAIFGGGPLHLLEGQPEYTQSLEYTPLLARGVNLGPPYLYVTAEYIALGGSRVPVPARALAAGGVALSTTVAFTMLHTDVYRPLVAAFRKAMEEEDQWQHPRTVEPVEPIGPCYDSRTLANTPLGYMVPSVTLVLDGGKNWTMTGAHSMVDVSRETACLAFMEMERTEGGDGNMPTVIVGGFQTENFVLQFDLEKMRLGFLRLPFNARCSHFNFTRRA